MTLILVLSLVGIGAILAELVLPGGILGVVGIGLLVAAVVVTFVQYGVTAGVIAAIILLVFGFVVLGWWMKYFHRLPLTRKLILQNESGAAPAREEKETLVGKTAVAITDIKPSGNVTVDGRKLDAIAESGSIPKDSEVTVVAMRGPSVVVRALD